MKIKQLWCVGFIKGEELELSFRVYDAVIGDETYTIDFNIPVKKGDFELSCRPDILTMSKIQSIDFKMIAQTDGVHIVKRLDKDSNFINKITPIIEAYLLNNQIHINFGLDQWAYSTLLMD